MARSEVRGIVFDALSNRVIGCALEVHRRLGPGLLESAYCQCLAHELSLAGLAFEMEVPLPVIYRNVKLDCGYRLDFVVERSLLLELKSVDALTPVHEAQVITYLKLSEIHAGLLINFNVRILKDGIRRFVV